MIVLPFNHFAIQLVSIGIKYAQLGRSLHHSKFSDLSTDLPNGNGDSSDSEEDRVALINIPSQNELSQECGRPIVPEEVVRAKTTGNFVQLKSQQNALCVLQYSFVNRSVFFNMF